MHLHLVFKWATENGTSKWQQPSSQQHFWPDREGRTVHGELQGEKKKKRKRKKVVQQMIQHFESRLFSMCMFCNSFTTSHSLLFQLLHQGHDNGIKKKKPHKNPSPHTGKYLYSDWFGVQREHTASISTTISMKWTQSSCPASLTWPHKHNHYNQK